MLDDDKNETPIVEPEFPKPPLDTPPEEVEPEVTPEPQMPISTEYFGEVIEASTNEVAFREPSLGEDWNFAPPSKETQEKIQHLLKELGRFDGKFNGRFGNISIFGLQWTVGAVAPEGWLKAQRYGIVNRDLALYLQEYAVLNGGYDVTTDQVACLNEAAWESIVVGLELEVEALNA